MGNTCTVIRRERSQVRLRIRIVVSWSKTGAECCSLQQRGGGEKGVIDLKQSTWVEGRTRNCKIWGFFWGAKRTTNTTTTINTSDYYYYYYYHGADQRSIRVAGLDFLHVKVNKSRGFLNHCFVVSWGSRLLARSLVSPSLLWGFFKNKKQKFMDSSKSCSMQNALVLEQSYKQCINPSFLDDKWFVSLQNRQMPRRMKC